mgnify:CR=1 FL=1
MASRLFERGGDASVNSWVVLVFGVVFTLDVRAYPEDAKRQRESPRRRSRWGHMLALKMVRSENAKLVSLHLAIGALWSELPQVNVPTHWLIGCELGREHHVFDCSRVGYVELFEFPQRLP